MAQEDFRARQPLLLREEINRLEEELEDKYYQFGRDVYEATERGIAEINHLVDKLVDAKVRYSALTGGTACDKCLTLNPPENDFCSKCGTPLPVAESRDEKG